MKRKVKSYLSETLRSLIDKLSPEEKLDCVIIVFVGEVRAQKHPKLKHRHLTKYTMMCGCNMSQQTDLDYVHSVVAGLEKELVNFLSSLQLHS